MSEVYYLQGRRRDGHSDCPWTARGLAPPPKTVRLAESPLLGYRLWRLGRARRRVSKWDLRYRWSLFSPTAVNEWDGPVLRADQRPAWSLRGSGIYALNRAGIEPLLPLEKAICDYLGLRDVVVGEVEGMGRCVIHEWGWRAEVVRITRLYVAPGSPGLLRPALWARYRCAVQEYSSFHP